MTSLPAKSTPQNALQSASAERLSNNLDKINQPAQSRKARQWLSQTLPSALTRHGHAELTFPHGLDPQRTIA
jgi:hypothetical protein